MSAEPAPRGGRETRLLIVTLVVSVGVLLLLARFRFPGEASQHPVAPAPAPLERLAARAAYDELASTMADLERRLTPRLVVYRSRVESGAEIHALAARMTAGRAIGFLPSGAAIDPGIPGTPGVFATDLLRQLVVFEVPSAADEIVSPRTGTFRTGPRYIVLAEASTHGPVFRPVYVGHTSAGKDARTDTPQIIVAGLQHPVPPGAAFFTLDGAFIGLVTGGDATSAAVAPADFLWAAAQEAVPSVRQAGELGVQVQALSPALARATGADTGVVVAGVHVGGPAWELVRPGDVIQRIDGTPVSTEEGFRQVERTRDPASDVQLQIVRERQPMRLTIPAAAREPGVRSRDEDHGIVGRSVAGAGVEVVAVQPASAAARAGVRRGDLVTLVVGSDRAPDAAALTSAFRRLADGQSLLLGVQRDGRQQVIALEKR